MISGMELVAAIAAVKCTCPETVAEIFGVALTASADAARCRDWVAAMSGVKLTA